MKKGVFVIFILVLLTETCLPFDGRSGTAKNPCIWFLDTSLTFYVVEIPDPICVDGVECHSIFKIALQKDSINKEFPYKITGLSIGDNSELKNLGYLRQDLKTNKIIWKRIIADGHFETVELQNIAEQTKVIYSNNKVGDSDEIIPISRILSECLALKGVDKYFNFIIRIFSYDTEPKEVMVDGKNSGIVCETVGGSSYKLLAIEFEDEFVYKDDYFQLYKKRIRNN
jgi:hypothetical protein